MNIVQDLCTYVSNAVASFDASRMLRIAAVFAVAGLVAFGGFYMYRMHKELNMLKLYAHSIEVQVARLSAHKSAPSTRIAREANYRERSSNARAPPPSPSSRGPPSSQSRKPAPAAAPDPPAVFQRAPAPRAAAMGFQSIQSLMQEIPASAVSGMIRTVTGVGQVDIPTLDEVIEDPVLESQAIEEQINDDSLSVVVEDQVDDQLDEEEEYPEYPDPDELERLLME